MFRAGLYTRTRCGLIRAQSDDMTELSVQRVNTVTWDRERQSQ